jgi:hypothetical protein
LSITVRISREKSTAPDSKTSACPHKLSNTTVASVVVSGKRESGRHQFAHSTFWFFEFEFETGKGKEELLTRRVERTGSQSST